jgi:hypothetical protein
MLWRQDHAVRRGRKYAHPKVASTTWVTLRRSGCI